MKTNTHFATDLAQFFLQREMFQMKVVEKIKTHISYSITFFFSKNVRFMRSCGKYSTAGEATDDPFTPAVDSRKA
jgi:hypothetical protein